MLKRPRALLGLAFCSLVLSMSPAVAEPSATQAEGWQSVVRESPYWLSQGVFENIKTIRRWVLTSSSYCAVKDRHILFDRRGQFLGYVGDAATAEGTQQTLNRLRQQMANDGRVEYWLPGADAVTGYPFALSCNQPDAELDVALARYSGGDPDARLWGTWDGMRVGSPEQQVSLHQAIKHVYEDRLERGRVSMERDVLSTLAGKALIESGGQKRAHSAANARGILQLSSAALNDCGLSSEFYFHRLAQVDCALRLLEQNHRNLEKPFKALFGHLPAKKAEQLYNMLLIQAYHGGVGRVRALLTEPKLKSAAAYFAEHHQQFSAGDIALGMVYHNLGRNELGFASLYYVIDVAVAKEMACDAFPAMAGC